MPTRRPICLCRAAELAHRRLKNPVRAEELLQRSLVYAPGSRESLDGLKVVYEQRNDPAALAETLERLALATPGSDAAPLYLKAGELQETRLGRRDRAVICYQLASRAAPKDRQALRAGAANSRGRGPLCSRLREPRAPARGLGDRELVEDYVAFAEELVNHPKDHGARHQGPGAGAGGRGAAPQGHRGAEGALQARVRVAGEGQGAQGPVARGARSAGGGAALAGGGPALRLL